MMGRKETGRAYISQLRRLGVVRHGCRCLKKILPARMQAKFYFLTFFCQRQKNASPPMSALKDDFFSVATAGSVGKKSSLLKKGGEAARRGVGDNKTQPQAAAELK